MGHTGDMYNYEDRYYNRYRSPGGSGVSSYSNKKEFIIVCKETGDTFEEDTYSDTEFNKLKEHFDFVDGKVPVLMLSKNELRFKKTYRQVLTCAYDATEKYLKSLLGRELSTADKEWYKSLPMMTSSGLPAQYTCTVLNELVRPYGVGISHIFYGKKPTINDDIAAWQKVLGVNPIGLVSRDASNEEYLAMAADNGEGGLNPDVVKVIRPQFDNFHFEYTDKVIAPCIVFQDMTAGYATGGGHASYRGPREAPGICRIAIQYDYIQNCKWLCAPPELPVMEASESYALDFSECLTKNGVPWKDVRYKGTVTHYTPSSLTPVQDSSPRGFVPSVQRADFGPNPHKWQHAEALTEKEAIEFLAELDLCYNDYSVKELEFDIKYATDAIQDIKKVMTKHGGYGIYYEHGTGAMKRTISEVMNSEKFIDKEPTKKITEMLEEMRTDWYANPSTISISDAYIIYHTLKHEGCNSGWFAEYVAFTILCDKCLIIKEKEDLDDTIEMIQTTADFVRFAETYYGTKWAESSLSIMYNPSMVAQLTKNLVDTLNTEDFTKQVQGFGVEAKIPENHRYWFVLRSAIEATAKPFIEKDSISVAEIFLIHEAINKNERIAPFSQLVAKTLIKEVVEPGAK